MIKKPLQESSRLAAGPWWLLYSGPIGPSEPHAHRASQLVVHGGGPYVSVDGDVRLGPIVIIPGDALHRVHDRRDHVLVLFVAPESVVGRQLARDQAGSGASLSGVHPVAAILGGLRMSNWSQADEAVRRTLEHVGGIDVGHSLAWSRHRALDKRLLDLPDGVAVDDVDLMRLSAQVGLPASRIADILTEGPGIPLGGYVRWLRIVTALERIAEGTDVGSAALAARFSGVDDLERASTSTFGLDPAAIAQMGDLLLAP